GVPDPVPLGGSRPGRAVPGARRAPLRHPVRGRRPPDARQPPPRQRRPPPRRRPSGLSRVPRLVHMEHVETVAYFDHAATTPLRREALDAMLPFLAGRFGNPSGSHSVSRDAKRALEEARETVAGCVGCEPGEVVFTGSGTEADNLAILGAVAARPGRAVCSAVEHHAVLHAVQACGGTTLPVVRVGVDDLDSLAGSLGGAGYVD